MNIKQKIKEPFIQDELQKSLTIVWDDMSITDEEVEEYLNRIYDLFKLSKEEYSKKYKINEIVEYEIKIRLQILLELSEKPSFKEKFKNSFIVNELQKLLTDFDLKKDSLSGKDYVAFCKKTLEKIWELFNINRSEYTYKYKD